MDAQELQEIRENIEMGVLDIEHSERLLAYVDALKTDMAKIHGIASQLMSLSQLAAATAGTDIYQITMPHVSEPENGA